MSQNNPGPSSWEIGSFHANNRMYTEKPPLATGAFREGPNGIKIPAKSPGVFPEDHFRVMKENKQILANYQKSFKKKSDMAMSRFDSEQNVAAMMPGGQANILIAGNPGLGPLAKRLMMDPDIDEKQALSLIQLPVETLYLIDKVVRQKASSGPIGIDNSEVINLEMENEFKKKNKHIFKLNNGEVGQQAAEELAEGYVDAEGIYHGVDQDEKLFQQNEKLLQRLTKAASLKGKLRPGAFSDVSQFGGANDQTEATDQQIINISNNQAADQSQMTRDQSRSFVGYSNAQQSYVGLDGQQTEAARLLAMQELAKKISHEEWVRRKDHETQLRQKLIIEAKRDLLETLLIKQEESAMRMQERAHQMFEWENRKKQHIHHKKLVEIQKSERERLEKQQKQEISYMKFKEWLKQSLIKQREEVVQKKIEKHQQKLKEDEDKRTKAHRRVLAKIAYKDWKQTKMEEEKLLKKKEQIQRRQGLFDSKAGMNSFRGPGQRRMVRHSSARGIQSDNSSRYINTDYKREQVSTRGGQTNIQVKTQSKSMRGGLKVSDQKKRPKTAGRTRAKPPKQSSHNQMSLMQQQQQLQQYNHQFVDQNGYQYSQAPEDQWQQQQMQPMQQYSNHQQDYLPEQQQQQQHQQQEQQQYQMQSEEYYQAQMDDAIYEGEEQQYDQYGNEEEMMDEMDEEMMDQEEYMRQMEMLQQQQQMMEEEEEEEDIEM